MAQLKHKLNLKAKQQNRREKLQNDSAEYREIWETAARVNNMI